MARQARPADFEVEKLIQVNNKHLKFAGPGRQPGSFSLSAKKTNQKKLFTCGGHFFRGGLRPLRQLERITAAVLCREEATASFQSDLQGIIPLLRQTFRRKDFPAPGG
jgi:hypothetical protein